MDDRKTKQKEIFKRKSKTPSSTLSVKNIDTVNDTWAIDISFMNYPPEYNDGFKYLLVCIDIFSRKAWIVPIKQDNLNADSVLSAFKKIVSMAGNKPSKIWADRDKLFYNKTFEKYIKDNNIILYSTGGQNKSVFVERLQRTLKDITHKLLWLNKSKVRWIDYIDDVVKQYNTSVHSTTNYKPNKVYSDILAQSDVRYKKNHEAKQVEMKEPKYKLNDIVRVSVVKGKLEKGHTQNWSSKLYRINTVLQGTPNTYMLVDAKTNESITGKFYEEELNKSTLKPKVKENKTVFDLTKSKPVSNPVTLPVSKPVVKPVYNTDPKKEKKRQKQDRPLSNIIEGKRTKKPINYRKLAGK